MKYLAGKTKTNPKLIVYDSVIEEAIKILEEQLKRILSKEKQYLARWIAIKLIDGDEKILKSIEKNLRISLLNNKKIKNKLKEIEEKLIDKKITRDNLREKIIECIVTDAEEICKECVKYENIKYQERDRKIDKLLTSKIWGIPIMLLFLGFILWLTIIGANYPSKMLSTIFEFIGDKLKDFFDFINSPVWLKSIIVDGMYKTLAWVVSVMLPPMAIFFPLFTLLEDLGVLPRIAFNLDKCFKKACTSRKTGTYNVHGAWM